VDVDALMKVNGHGPGYGGDVKYMRRSRPSGTIMNKRRMFYETDHLLG
jgi:hypothetical protein